MLATMTLGICIGWMIQHIGTRAWYRREPNQYLLGVLGFGVVVSGLFLFA